jgi:hypothetical protein
MIYAGNSKGMDGRYACYWVTQHAGFNPTIVGTNIIFEGKFLVKTEHRTLPYAEVRARVFVLVCSGLTIRIVRVFAPVVGS